MKLAASCLSGAILLALQGCAVHADFIPEPAWEASLELPEPERRLEYVMRKFQAADIPPVVHVGSVQVSGSGAPSDLDLAKRGLRYINEHELPADVAVYSGREVFNDGGSTSVYYGFGVSGTQATQSAVAAVHLFRWAPAYLGVTNNSDGMVTHLDPFVADQSGLLEGDTIVSIDGVPPHDGEREVSGPFAVRMLRWRPGDVVRVIWIRPGGGRMEGEITLQEPPAYQSAPE